MKVRLKYGLCISDAREDALIACIAFNFLSVVGNQSDKNQYTSIGCNPVHRFIGEKKLATVAITDPIVPVLKYFRMGQVLFGNISKITHHSK